MKGSKQRIQLFKLTSILHTAANAIEYGRLVNARKIVDIVASELVDIADELRQLNEIEHTNSGD
jgi:hypothetical protein